MSRIKPLKKTFVWPPIGNNGRIQIMLGDIAGFDVLKLVDDFFTAEKLDWDKLGSICTDGAPSMLGV